MKHQYFGDINDFYKYSLLQILCLEGKLKLGVCWMLTPDDRRNDGRRVEYLNAPEKWRAYNPRLFDFLTHCVRLSRTRNVRSIESCRLLRGARFYREVFTDSADGRRRCFSEIRQKFAHADLIFFDPDNGFEIKSVPLGSRNSSKYLYWLEVSEVYKANHSVLVYHHFPRRERSRFVSTLARMLRTSTGAAEIHVFCTSHVAFLLAPQQERIPYFRRAATQVQKTWSGQFKVHQYRKGPLT